MRSDHISTYSTLFSWRRLWKRDNRLLPFRMELLETRYRKVSPVKRSFTLAILGCAALGPLASAQTGRILFERWDDSTIVDMLDLRYVERFIGMRPPSAVEYLTEFDTGENLGSRFVGRIRGWLVIPVSGDYTFSVASDDSSRVWLSTEVPARNASTSRARRACAPGPFMHRSRGRSSARRLHQVEGRSELFEVRGQRYYHGIVLVSDILVEHHAETDRRACGQAGQVEVDQLDRSS